MKTRSNNQSRTTTWAAKIAKALGLAGLLSATTLAQSTPSEVVSGATGSAPSSYVAMGGNIYFVATNAANGTELWKWDGTSASLAADINSGAGSSDPAGLTVFNNELLFSATDGTNGRELWKFDGTTASMVSNINAGAGDSDPQYLTEYNGDLYFSASNGSYTGAGGPVGRELWKYNGTTSSLVKDIYAGGIGSFGITNEGDPKNFVVATVSSGTYLFFQATTADGIELWRSTGTTAGTVLVKNIYTGSTGLPPVVNSSSPENLTAFNGELVFTATTADGTELWKSNGTSAGTVMVSNLAAGSASSSPAYLKVLDASTLLFAANDGTNGTELWKYDGSTMSLVKDIRTGANSSGPANLHIWNGMALFAANDGTNGNELWKSDGTAAGTVLVKDINAGLASSNPNGFTSVTTFCTDGVIFGATTAAAGLEPWRTGGSTASTKFVQDIRSGATGSMSSPASFVSNGLNIIFTANNGSTGTEPFILKSWIFDETAPTVTCPSGTSAVANGSCQSSIPDYCAPATAADNCNVVTRAQSPAVGAVANLGANPITVTITDENGNSASCSATFTVVDSTAPSITAPAAIAQNNNSGLCYATVSLGSATTSDNCSVSSTVNNAPATFPVGTTSVVWTVTDGSGNTNAATQSVVITDNQDPSITAPAAATAVVDAGICTSSSVVLGSATTGDNCGVASVTNNGSSPYALGNTTVTWTAVDVNGRSKTATQLVTITDNQDPAITAPGAVSVNADLGACSASPALGSASTSDNCSVTSVSNNGSAPYAVGTTTVVWTVVDGSGRSKTANQSVTVIDNQNPTISAPANKSVNTDTGLCTAVVALGTPTVGDNCAVSGSATNNAPATFPVGTTSVTWTVLDIHGNSNTATQSVAVTDDEDPTITAPANKSVNNDTGLCTAVVSLGSPIVGDNCGVSGSATNNAPAAFPVGTTSVTWTVLDIYGNSNTAAQSVVVTDDEDPTITAPANKSVDADSGVCFASGVALGSPSTNDNCGVSGSATNNAPATFPVGTTTVTWTVLDIHGNSNTAAQSVAVADIQIPSISAPANKSVNTDTGLCTAVVALGTPTVGDNCAVSGSATNNAPAAFPVGSTTVTWTVLDIHGNSNTATQSVAVADNEVPSISAPANKSVNNDTGLCTAVVSLGSPIVGDNCGVSGSATNNAPATFPVGTTSVIWTVLDIYGNSNTAAQSVVVADNEVPSISAPANQSVNADSGVCFASGVVLGSPSTNDNCGVSGSATNNAPATFPVGTTTVTWTVLDIHGNSNTAAQSVAVADIQIPSISAPANKSVNNDAGLCTAVVALGTPTVGDNCAVSGSATNNAPATFPVGTTSVTWTVLDIHGNSNTAAQSVAVADNEAPSISAPANKSVNNDTGLCTAVVALGTPTVGDNCAVSGSATNNAPAAFPVGATSVTWTVLDIYGNSNTAAQSVVVADAEAPSISAPANKSVNADSGVCFASGVALGSASTNDNCGVSGSATNNAPATFPVGTTTVTWTVLDIHGNSNTAAQSVAVADIQIPSISAPANKSVNTDTGLCTAVVALGTPTVGDNCAVSGSATNNAPAAFPVGSTTVTWTVLDIHGNSNTATQSVAVADNEVPSISAPANKSVNNDAGLCTAVVALGTPTVGDNCAVSGSATNNAPATFPVGTTSVIWTVLDIYGNSNTAAQSVVVADNEVPSISAPANQSVNADSGVCFASGVVLGSPSTNDNCGVSGSATNNAPATFPVGTTSVTWTVLDIHGNSNTAAQSVAVADIQIPSISAPANKSVNNDAGLCTAVVALGTPTVGDNCAVSGSATNNAPATFPVGTTSVTWTVLDIHGNSNTATQSVAVADNEAPSISAPANKSVNNDTGLCTAVVALGTPTVGDNCAVSGSATNNAPAAFPVGTTSVTWTVLDIHGNSNTAAQSVVVADAEAPSISAPANKSVNADSGVCFASGVALGSASTNDNCGVSGSATNNAPATFPVGTTTVTWTVLDIHGNSNTAAQSVIVADNQNPTITAPADVTANTGAGICTVALASLGTPVTADNCAVSTTVNNAPASFPMGVTTVVWTVTDVNGRSAVANQSVSIIDRQAPSITAPAAVILSSDAGSCAKANPAIGTATATDNCGVSTVNSNVAASYPVGGPYTITWTATDTSGLTATATQSLTIRDTEFPTITAPAAVTTPADAGSCAKALPILGTPVTADNCAISLALSNFNPPYAVGVHTITWFAQDIYGNQTTATQSLTVTDTQNPTISAPATVNAVTDAGICTASGVVLGSPITADNCAISGTVNSGTATYALGSTTVTWTTTDVNGRTASATQLVIVADNQDPTITAPSGITTVTAFGLCTAAPALGTPTTNDNCSVSSTVNNAPAAFPVGATTVVWTVTDGSGRTAVANQVVTVSDDQDPTITAPATFNGNADVGACSAAVVALGSPVTADNCAVSATSNTGSAPYAVGSTTVTWTVTDVNGRSASATQLVIIADNQNPTITAPATVNAVTDAGLCTASGVVLGSATTADNCGVSGTVNNGTATYALGSNTVTWTVTDVNGRTASAAQLVIVADNQNPTISAPAAINVSTSAGLCTASPSLGSPTTNDNCSISSTVNNAPASFAVGTTTVIWTVTDGSGRSATANQSVTVSDNENPVVTAPATVNVNADSGLCSAASVSLGSATSSDNCGVSSTLNNGSAPYAVGSTTVTWTVTDIYGRTASAAQLVVVADNQNPTITAPAAVSSDTNIGACVATGLALGTPVTADNCAVSSVANNAPASFTIGTVSVIWTVTDVNGRTATASQSVTVSDNQNPSITAPANVNTVTGRGICTASPAIGTAISTDNCAVSSTTNNAPATFPLGTTTVVWTATDSSGRTASVNQLVVVVDNQDPTISAPAAITTVTASGLCTASPALGTPVTADNCSVSSTVNNAPAAFPVGSTTVVWTVTDGSGRTATASQSVSVSDNQNPTISAPANVTRGTDAGICTASNVALGSPIVADNCGINATSNNAPRTFALGSTTVTWTTTDVNGRSATAAQSVTINDTELPTLTSPAGFLTNTDAGVCYSTRALGNATFGDNCGVSTTVNNAPAQLPIGATTVTWTVTDVNGNSASALQFVVVADQRAPQFTAAPSPVSVNTTAGLCTANVALSAPAATDNCTLGSVLPNPSSSIFPLGSTTVTWTATDIYGNSATATQSVTVSDAQLPTVSCPANVSQSCELSTAPATTGTATGADNCSVASVNYVDGALTGGTCTNTGTFNRVWTVTDGSGNSASCTQVITRVDATAPVLSMPSNATVQCNSSYLPAVTGSATATDNCSVAPSVTYSDAAPVAGACANSSSVLRTWVATDSCGNSSSNTQTISIVDTTAPVISAPSNIIVQCGTSTAPATTGTATATDNCDAAPSVTYSDSSVTTCGSANVTSRTWRATDACGNSSTAVQTISVVDTTPPVVVGPTILTLGLQNGGMPNIVPLVTVNDACGTVTSTQSPAAGSAASLGATTVNLTSTDSCGNSVVTPITVVISGLGANTIDLGYGCGSGVNVMGSTFPVIGSDLSIAVDTDSPFAFLGLFYDPSNFVGPVFIAPGCGVHIDISVAQPFGIVSTNANGDFSATLPLPSIPQLLGFNPRMQGIVFAGSSPLGSFQLLNGIQLVSGVYAPYVTARAPQLALPTGSGAVLDANYTSSFPTGLVVGAQNFPGNSIGLVALKAFLANPNTQPAQFGGVLGQELAALKVNIALNAAGHLASTNNNLGSVRYRNVQVADAYNGMTLNQIAAAADAAIIAGNAATSSALALVIHQINDAFAGTAPSTFATSYLYNATF